MEQDCLLSLCCTEEPLDDDSIVPNTLHNYLSTPTPSMASCDQLVAAISCFEDKASGGGSAS